MANIATNHQTTSSDLCGPENFKERPTLRNKTEVEQGKERVFENSEIDPLMLPYVTMSELCYLPTCSGIYFAIEESGQVAYIGQSGNIRKRWRAHHVQGELCDSDDLTSAWRVRIAWLEVGEASDISLLANASLLS